MTDTTQTVLPAGADPYQTMGLSLDGPAASFYAVTPSDTEPLPIRPRAIRVGVGGDIVAGTPTGGFVLIKNCKEGELIAFRPTQIKATGTTAGNLVALV